MITERKREAVKGFIPAFEVGEIVYFNADPEMGAWVVCGYGIMGERHEKVYKLKCGSDYLEAYPFELTGTKPLDGTV